MWRRLIRLPSKTWLKNIRFVAVPVKWDGGGGIIGIICEQYVIRQNCSRIIYNTRNLRKVFQTVYGYFHRSGHWRPGEKCDIRDWPGKTLHFGFFLHRIDVASRENAIPAFSVWWVLLWRGESRYRKLLVFQFFRKTTSTYIPSGRISKITRITHINT